MISVIPVQQVFVLWHPSLIARKPSILDMLVND